MDLELCQLNKVYLQELTSYNKVLNQRNKLLKDIGFQPGLTETLEYAAAIIITFMGAWNNYLWPKVILQNKDAITMPMLVSNLLSGYTVDYGMLMLGVFICTIPTAIIFFAFQKSFTEGITGAVK